MVVDVAAARDGAVAGRVGAPVAARRSVAGRGLAVLGGVLQQAQVAAAVAERHLEHTHTSSVFPVVERMSFCWTCWTVRLGFQARLQMWADFWCRKYLTTRWLATFQTTMWPPQPAVARYLPQGDQQQTETWVGFVFGNDVSFDQ